MGAFTSEVYLQTPTVDLRAIHGFLCGGGLLFGLISHEAKASRAPRLAVYHHLRVGDFAKAGEGLTQTIV